MSVESRLFELTRECEALHALLAHACETLMFYGDRANYNAADDGIERRALDELDYISAGGDLRAAA